MNKDFLFYALKIPKSSARFCLLNRAFVGSYNNFLFFNKFITIESIFNVTVFLFLCIRNKSSIFFLSKNRSIDCIYKAIILQSEKKLIFDIFLSIKRLDIDNMVSFSIFFKEHSSITKYLFDKCIPCVSFVDSLSVFNKISFPILLNNNSIKMHFFLSHFFVYTFNKNFLDFNFKQLKTVENFCR